MDQHNILKNVKIWGSALLLSLTTFLYHWIQFFSDEHYILSNLMWISYFISFLLIGKIQDDYKTFLSKINSFFIFCIVACSILFSYVFNMSNNHLLINVLNGFYLFLLTLIGFSFIDRKSMLIVLNRYYFIVFFICIFLFFYYGSGQDKLSNYLPTNVLGFMITPFLIYLLINNKKLPAKLLIFTAGSIALFYIKAFSVLAIFLALPIFILIYNKIKRPRIIFLALLILGFLGTFIIASINSLFLTDLFSTRNIYWTLFIDESLSSAKFFLFGNGPLTEAFFIEGLNPYNTFIYLFHLYGIFSLLLYVCYIIFSIRKFANYFTVSDGILILCIMFQFVYTNTPLFSFLFPSFIFLANSFLNEYSEDTMNK